MTAAQGSPTVEVTFDIVGGNDTAAMFDISYCSGQVVAGVRCLFV